MATIHLDEYARVTLASVRVITHRDSPNDRLTSDATSLPRDRLLEKILAKLNASGLLFKKRERCLEAARENVLISRMHMYNPTPR